MGAGEEFLPVPGAAWIAPKKYPSAWAWRAKRRKPEATLEPLHHRVPEQRPGGYRHAEAETKETGRS